MTRPLTAIDLFAGAGGLSLGLREAGWQVQAAIEYDANAVATHQANFPGVEHVDHDVKLVDFKKYKGVDLVAGGPPCQPFSVSGKRLGSFDLRDMVPEFVRAVEDIRPRAFMMENVAGLTAKRFEKYLIEQTTKLHDLGYTVFSRVLTASDYGVPQNRRRLFLVGIRSDQMGDAFSYPEPTHGPDAISDYVTVEQALADVPEDIPNRAKVVFCKSPILRRSPFAGMLFNGQGRPLNARGLGHTIPASAGGNRTHIVDLEGEVVKYHRYLLAGKKPRTGVMEGVRRLTVRESARLQSFPDSFEFMGGQSTRYSQVGNAVPPLLAAAVARRIEISLR